MKERGFNQAKIISIFFQKYLRVPICDLLERKKYTKSQAQLTSKIDRYKNLSDAFIIEDGKKASRNSFILIDDVVTSGSTVKEAAKVLKVNGAKKVFILTLAKG